MIRALLEVYSDDLIISSSQTTATGLSKVLDGQTSPDKITRFLSQKDLTSKDLWKLVKPTVRQCESDDGVLVVDDSIEGKPHSKENEMICWHYDHSVSRNVKGINMVNLLYSSKGVNLPISFEIIKKTETCIDKKTGREKRVSLVTKNEIFRDFISQATSNNIKFKYVISDSWFSSKDNMIDIKLKHQKDFVLPVKSNRTLALSEKDKHKGAFISIKSLRLEAGSTSDVYLRGLDFPVRLIKQVFTNKDGSCGELFLVSSDRELSFDEITAIYQKRWKVEDFYKSVKSNASFAKSPASTVRTQSNHCFAAIYAFVKLEKLRIRTTLNHFAIKGQIYIEALKIAYDKLEKMSGTQNRLALV